MAILGFANGLAGVVEWLEAVEQGDEPVRAAKKAYVNARRRKSAVTKAGKKKLRSREAEEEGVVIDVTPRIRKEGSR